MANTINRWDPRSGVVLRDTYNQLVDGRRAQPLSWNGNEAHHVPLNIYETGDALCVRAFLPGITEDQIEVTVERNTITIRAEQPVEQPEGIRYHLRERSSGTWVRSFTLPTQIDVDRIDATLRDGVLALTLPKRPEAQPYHVTINGA